MLLIRSELTRGTGEPCKWDGSMDWRGREETNERGGEERRGKMRREREIQGREGLWFLRAGGQAGRQAGRQASNQQRTLEKVTT